MINYIDIGNGEKTILMIHGLGQTKESWRSQFELSDTYRLIAVDLRGHGESENINTDITLKNMALDIIELMSNLHLESAYMLGLSLGGLVVQELYRQKPEICEGLILCNTTWFIPTYFANKIVNKSEKLFHEDKEQLIEYIVNAAIHNKDTYEEAKQSFYLSDVYLDCALSGIGYNYFPVLLRLNKPLLLIGGNYDRTTPLITQVIMRWLCPRSELITLECGHLSNIECKEDFNQAIRNFIG
jgi:pimeloyl-ACP methyl ester carboxylesterase